MTLAFIMAEQQMQIYKHKLQNQESDTLILIHAEKEQMDYNF